MAIAKDASDHPILKGVEPFETPSKLYKNPHIADDTNLLLTGTIPDHTEPVAWTRDYEVREFSTRLWAGRRILKRKCFERCW